MASTNIIMGGKCSSLGNVEGKVVILEEGNNRRNVGCERAFRIPTGSEWWVWRGWMVEGEQRSE